MCIKRQFYRHLNSLVGGASTTGYLSNQRVVTKLYKNSPEVRTAAGREGGGKLTKQARPQTTSYLRIGNH